MVQAIGLLLPASLGGGISVAGVALTTAAGGLTFAGSLVNLGLGLALTAALAPDIPSIKPNDGRANVPGEVEPRRLPIGRILTGGQVIFNRAHADVLHRVIAHGEGPVFRVLEVRLDKRVVQLDDRGAVLDAPWNNPSFGGDGFLDPVFNSTPQTIKDLYPAGWFNTKAINSRQFQSYANVQTRLGRVPNLPYAVPVEAAADWSAAHRMDGIWSTYATFRQEGPTQQQSTYPNGAPSVEVLADTSSLRDPRTGMVEYSDNAALAIAFLIEHPDVFGLAGRIDDATLIEAANDADAERPLASGGSTAMWRAAGLIRLVGQPQQMIGPVMKACGGEIRLRPDGKIAVHVGGPKEPVVTLTDDDLHSIEECDDGPDRLERYTRKPFTYVSEDLDYRETTGDEWVDVAAEAQGDPVTEGENLDAAFAPNHAQARHAAKLATAMDNPRSRYTVRFFHSALPAIYERTIRWRSEVFGVDAVFRVLPSSMSTADRTILLRLEEYDPSVRNWSIGEEGDPPELPSDTSSDDVIEAPTGLQAAGVGLEVSSGTFSPGIAVAWDEIAAANIVYTLVYRRSVLSGPENSWINWPISSAATSTIISGLVDGADYDAALIAARRPETNPTQGEAVQINNVTAADTANIPIAPTITGHAVNGSDVLISVTASTSQQGRFTELLRDGVRVGDPVRTVPSEAITILDTPPGAGVYSYTARSRSLSGLLSVQSASEDVTII